MASFFASKHIGKYFWPLTSETPSRPTWQTTRSHSGTGGMLRRKPWKDLLTMQWRNKEKKNIKNKILGGGMPLLLSELSTTGEISSHPGTGQQTQGTTGTPFSVTSLVTDWIISSLMESAQLTGTASLYMTLSDKRPLGMCSSISKMSDSPISIQFYFLQLTFNYYQH